MYKAIDIAKYAVDKCTMDNVPISNLQLQKIMYFIQLNFLRNLNKIAFEEDIIAWQHGPVVQEVYDVFNMYGGTRIIRFFADSRNIFTSQNEKDLIDRVIIACRNLSPWELVNRSHQPKGPWASVYRGYPTLIPKELIREYSKEK